MQVYKATLSDGQEVSGGARVRATSDPHRGERGEFVMIHSYPSKAGGRRVLVWVRLDDECGMDAFAPEGLEAE